MNPFDLPGPQFLLFYAVLFVVLMGLAAYFRWSLRLPSDDIDIESLKPSEVAYLAGGADRAIDAAIARLVHSQVLAVDTSQGRLTKKRDVPVDAPKLERAIVLAAAAEGGAKIADVREAAKTGLEPIRERLEELGLVVDSRTATPRIFPLVVALIVPLVGVIKIGVGVSRDRPVGFLVFGTIFAAIVALAAFARPVLRSRRGDRVLARLKDDNAAMEVQIGRRADDLSGDDLMLAVGLFGVGVLSTGPLVDLHSALRKSSSANSSWASSCSSTGCGGGGGCGGGCGGCGG